MARPKTIRSILAATDFSECAHRAAHRAALLAHCFSAKLKLFHVVPHEPTTPFDELLRGSTLALRKQRESANERLTALAHELEQSVGVHATHLVRAGDLIDTVSAAADKYDLLVIGANGRRASDLLLGSIAARLVTRSRRPILIVRGEPAPEYRRVLVPLDFSVHSIATLEYAACVAPNAEFALFHALERSGAVEPAAPTAAHRPARDEARAQAVANIENIRDMADLPASGTTIVIERGPPGERIAEKALAMNADLIVMGKHSRTAVEEFFVGGTTRHTIMRARCDLIVLPERAGPRSTLAD